MKLRPWEFYDRIARAYDSMYETPKWKLYHRLIGSFLEEYLKTPAEFSISVEEPESGVCSCRKEVSK